MLTHALISAPGMLRRIRIARGFLGALALVLALNCSAGDPASEEAGAATAGGKDAADYDPAQDAFTAYGDMTPRGDTRKRFQVRWSWVNKGVAPCYPGGHPAITLKDEKGGIVAVLVDDGFDLGDLKVGAPGKAPLREITSEFIVALYSPTTRPGTYDLYVSLGRADGTPVVAMPLAENDGQRRYRLGRITLIAGAEATGGAR